MGYLAVDTNPERGLVWLESEFWKMLQAIADEAGKSREALIREAFALFGTNNRSASVRTYIGNHFRMKAKRQGALG